MIACPSCGTQVDTNSSSCPVCAWDFAGGAAGSARPATVIQPSTRPKLPVTVLVGLDVDITGSSGPFADGIRANIDLLARGIDAKAASSKWYVQTHGDEDDGQVPTLVVDGGPATDAVAAVRSLHFDGGGDPPEHHLNAIEHLASLLPAAAGTQQRTALVSFTTADTKPARSGRTPEDIGAELLKKQWIVCLVGEPGTQLDRLGRACNAFMFPISATPTPAEMKRVAEQVAASIVASLTRGSTRPLTQPVTT